MFNCSKKRLLERNKNMRKNYICKNYQVNTWNRKV